MQILQARTPPSSGVASSPFMSPTRHGLPTLYEATPFPGVPRCFVRYYDLRRAGVGRAQLVDGEFVAIGDVTPLFPDAGTLPIFGYSCRSTYAEDRAGELDVWNRRQAFPAVSFSELDPDGEFGFVPWAECLEIEKPTLEGALASLGVQWVRGAVRDN